MTLPAHSFIPDSLPDIPGGKYAMDTARPVRAGHMLVSRQSFAAMTGTDVQVPVNAVLIVLPVKGHLAIASGPETQGERLIVNASEALLLARPETVSLISPEGATARIIHLPRYLLQAAASLHFGGARRISLTHRAVRAEGHTGLNPWLDLWRGLPEGRRTYGRQEAESLVRLVTALGETHGPGNVFPLSRSTTRAMEIIGMNNGAVEDAAQVALAAGVTLATLRKGFRACLGMTMAAYIQDVRLVAAWRSLTSGHDARQMTEIAESVGYRTASSFSRAFQLRFGQNPSKARAQAVFNL